MKKIFGILLVLSLSLLLFGCAPKEEDPSSLPDITFDPTPAATPVVVEKEKSTVEAVTITGEGVNIRSEANTDCEILGEADKGQVFKLLDKSNKAWLKISYEGEDAFVSADFAKVGQVDAAKLKDKPAASDTGDSKAEKKDAESTEESGDESSKEDAGSSKEESGTSKAANADEVRSEEDPQPVKRGEG